MSLLINWKQLSVTVGSLGLAGLVLAVTLVRTQRVVLGFEGEAQELVQLRVEPNMTADKLALIKDLPESNVWPGSPGYPVERMMDWVWWRLADGKQEKARRKLWLANERLRTGYELVQAGDEASGIEILTKAQAYLQGAYELGEPSEQWGKELAWSAEKHEQVLQVIEPEVGEVLRPRVTELLDRCRLVSSESAGMR